MDSKEKKTYRYDAFISYRHSELDMEIAKKVHKGLETFKVPKSVQKITGKKDIHRVFRDQEELPIGSDLDDNISAALASSEYLLVICSPRTPESYWVEKEITTFIQMHGRQHILAILVEGEPGDSFPKLLLEDEDGNPVEPLAADVRGETEKERNTKLKTEIMRLAAPLLGCTYDDLRQRHRERRMKKILTLVSSAAAIVAALGIAFGLYNARQVAIITKQADDIARQNEEIKAQSAEIQAQADEIIAQYSGKQVNQSTYLANTSAELLKAGDREAAVQVALAALPSEEQDRPFVADAQYALTQALHTYDIGIDFNMDRMLHTDMPVTNIEYSPSGESIIAIDKQGTAYIWKVSDGELLYKQAGLLSDEGALLDTLAAGTLDDCFYFCSNDRLFCCTFAEEVKWEHVFDSRAVFADVSVTAGYAAVNFLDHVEVYQLDTGALVGTFTPSVENMTFDNEGKMTAEGIYVNSISEVLGGKAYVQWIDFVNGKEACYPLEKDSVNELCITPDGNVAVLSADFKSMFLTETETKLEVFSPESGKCSWSKMFSVQNLSEDSTSHQVRGRQYTDDEGQLQSELCLTLNNQVITFDLFTGEEKARLMVSYGISSFMLAQNSPMGYLGQLDGTVDIANLTTGVKYTSNAISTDKNLRQVILKNGVMAVRDTSESGVTLMCYHTAENASEIAAFNDYIRNIITSPEETCYCVQDGYEIPCLTFFDAATDELLTSYVPEDNQQPVEYCFVSEDSFFVLLRDGQAIILNVRTGETKETTLSENGYLVKAYLNEAEKKAYVLDYGEMMVVDATSLETIETLPMPSGVYEIAVSKDGKYIYGTSTNKKVFLIEMEELRNLPEGQDVDAEEDYLKKETSVLVATNTGLQDGGVVMSPDNRFLAIATTDGNVVFWDVAANKVAYEVMISCRSNGFIAFPTDSGTALVQGDDKYLYIVDIDKQQLVYQSSLYYGNFVDAKLSENGREFIVNADHDLYVLDAESLRLITYIPYGRMYLDKAKKTYIVERSRKLWMVPYASLEELIDMAGRQFPGSKLTAVEKAKYLVD